MVGQKSLQNKQRMDIIKCGTHSNHLMILKRKAVESNVYFLVMYQNRRID